MKPSGNVQYWVDCIIFLLFLLVSVSGGVLACCLPKGAGHVPFFFLSRFSWKMLHLWSGVMFVSLVFVHLLLHYRWIIVMTKKVFGARDG